MCSFFFFWLVCSTADNWWGFDDYFAAADSNIAIPFALLILYAVLMLSGMLCRKMGSSTLWYRISLPPLVALSLAFAHEFRDIITAMTG